MSRTEQVRVDLVAKDQASDVVEDLADDVQALERDDTEIVLRARADALRSELRTVRDDLARLQADKVVVDVDVDAPKVRKVVDDVGRGGSDAGKAFGAGFVRDIGAPIGGGAENVIGDLADSFATAGETIGGLFGGRLGSSIAGIGTTLATAFGVGGVAFLAVKGLWDLFDNRADQAKKKLKEVQDTQLLMATGRTVDAVKKLMERYGDAIDNAAELGATVEDSTRFILGSADALGRYSSRLDITGDDLADTMMLQREFNDLTLDQAQAVADLLQPLYRARREYSAAGDSLADLQREQFNVLRGVGATRDAFLQLAGEALPEVRAEIVDYVAAAEGIPSSVVTSIRADANPDDVAQVRRVLDDLAAGRTAKVRAEVEWTLDERNLQRQLDDALRRTVRRNGPLAYG